MESWKTDIVMCFKESWRAYAIVELEIISIWLILLQVSTQSVKNLPAVLETQVRFLGQEDPLEK